MNKEELKERFKQYAIAVARFVLKLPYNTVNKTYSDQLNRAASSAAANYRAALRAKSRPDFINKFKIVEEELDESLFFLELVEAINPEKSGEIKSLSAEGMALLSIIVAALRTLRNSPEGPKS